MAQNESPKNTASNSHSETFPREESSHLHVFELLSSLASFAEARLRLFAHESIQTRGPRIFLAIVGLLSLLIFLGNAVHDLFTNLLLITLVSAFPSMKIQNQEVFVSFILTASAAVTLAFVYRHVFGRLIDKLSDNQ